VATATTVGVVIISSSSGQRVYDVGVTQRTTGGHGSFSSHTHTTYTNTSIYLLNNPTITPSTTTTTTLEHVKVVVQQQDKRMMLNKPLYLFQFDVV